MLLFFSKGGSKAESDVFAVFESDKKVSLLLCQSKQQRKHPV